MLALDEFERRCCTGCGSDVLRSYDPDEIIRARGVLVNHDGVCFVCRAVEERRAELEARHDKAWFRGREVFGWLPDPDPLHVHQH